MQRFQGLPRTFVLIQFSELKNASIKYLIFARNHYRINKLKVWFVLSI
ncbi:hypothetical protein ADICYQ_1147 [Cyclobacterium qasimii M12-11B]|uniref:Uncharacterized protein n=1 Tax=Cyclobacterium qasimii M12-11B TaxID=641524 RepID=S7VIZ5_9BACT|nr:hypothetical protein ADICYQ_1147 [Cyclobacterium qasimii M12-11B]